MFIAAPGVADTPFQWTNNGSTINLTSVAQVRLDSGLATNSAFGVTLVEGQLKGTIYPDVVLSGGTAVTDLFRTFCVENGIYFTPGTVYHASIDRVAYSGSQAGTTGDPISDVSEYIYDGYRTGTITNLTGIRDAIWWAEGEGGVKNTIVDNALTALYGATDMTSAGLRSAGHTWAMNLWTLAFQNGVWVATDVQSHLVTVPIPGAVLLGALGLVAARRKLRKLV